MSILNGNLFDDDDLPIASKSVLYWYYEVSLSYGQNRAAFDCISIIVNPAP